jgi:hypothetical protein
VAGKNEGPTAHEAIIDCHPLGPFLKRNDPDSMSTVPINHPFNKMFTCHVL